MKPWSSLAALLVLGAVAGCTAPNGNSEFNDPYEKTNRVAHEANVQIDRNLLKPTSQAYGTAIPAPIRAGMSNFAKNLNQPTYIVNDLLQLKVEDLVSNTFRLVINTTVGIGGIFDPATALGLPAKSNDFGKTLHVWGVPEGAYLEVEFIGPTTERDLAGKVVDTITNPLRYAFPNPPESYVPTIASLTDLLNTRFKYTDTFDSLLYGSADGYAQARLLYLQNRHFELGEKQTSNTYDPYEDPYGN